MPISQHLLRKLQEALGLEAADDLVNLLEAMDAHSGDVKELRHVMELRLTDLRAELRVVESRLEKKVETSIAELRTSLEHGLRDQTRFFFLAWAVLIASNIALWFR